MMIMMTVFINDNYDDHVHPNLHLGYEPGDDHDNHIYHSLWAMIFQRQPRGQIPLSLFLLTLGLGLELVNHDDQKNKDDGHEPGDNRITRT